MNNNLRYQIFLLLFFVAKIDAGFNFANKDSKINLKSANSKLILDAPLSLSGTLSLKDNSADVVSGNNITFVEGVLESGLLTTFFTGTYDTTNTDKIVLQAGDSLDVQAGIVPVPIEIAGAGTSISGRFFLTQDISITSTAADVTLYVQTPISKNINLNNATLNLGSDAKLGESVQIIGPGTVNFNNNRLTLGTQDLIETQSLTFTGSANIELNADVVLDNCNWIFADVGGSSVINGNGHAINLGSNGRLQLANNHELIINNAYITGLGDGLTDGKILFGNDNSTVFLREVTLDLVDDYSLSNGQIYIKGVNSYLLAREFVLNLSGTSLLTVDRVAFIWDHLSLNNDIVPIIPVSSGNLALINGGYIRSVNETLQPIYIYSTSSSMLANIDVTASSNLIFSNASPLVPKTINFTGNGHFVQFSRNNLTQNIILQDNISLYMSNVVLKDFNPSSIGFGANSTLTFNDDVTLELAKDTYLDASFNFAGNIIISGNGQKLTLTNDNSIVLNGSGKNLVLENLNLYQLGGPSVGSGLGRIRINDPASTITFRNCTINLDNDYTLTQGGFIFDEVVKITGIGKTFTYTSSAQSQILPSSNLVLDQYLTFAYQADVGILPANGTPLSYAQSRNRLKLMANTSILTLDGATMTFTTTGLQLDTGIMIVKDHVTLQSAATVQAEKPVLKADLAVKILAGAVLDLQGKFLYD